MTRASATSLLFVVCALAPATRVRAQPQTDATGDDEEAKQTATLLLKEGNDLFRAGDHTAALDRFITAYRAFPSPKLHFNIAQAEAALGHTDRAARAYQLFITGMEAEARPPQAAIADARKALDALAAGLGRIDLTVSEPDATIVLDGEGVDRSPLGHPVWVGPGEHTVGAHKDGFTQPVALRTVVAGESVDVTLELRPFAEATAPPPAPVEPATPRPPPPAVTSPPRPAPVATATTPPPPAYHTGRLERWAWIATGTAGALALGATTAGLMMKSRHDDLRSSCGAGAPGQPGCSNTQIDGVRTRRNVANVLWVGTGLAAAWAGTMFYLAAQPTSGGVALGDGGTILAGGRF